MMAELYGKCRENGSCICDGLGGCIDETNALSMARNKPLTKLPKPIIIDPVELEDMEDECGICKRWGHPCKRHGGGALPKKQAKAEPCPDCGKTKRSNHVCSRGVRGKDWCTTCLSYGHFAEDCSELAVDRNEPENLPVGEDISRSISVPSGAKTKLTLQIGSLSVTIEVSEGGTNDER